MFDEGGDVINRIVFLNEHLGVLEVPPQTLLEISEDAMEIVIGNKVGEKHKENDSPALPAAALFADLFCLIAQSTLMNAADTIKVVGIDLNFFILKDMLPPDTMAVSIINVVFLHEGIESFVTVIETLAAPLFIDGFLFRGGFRDGALIGTEGVITFNIIGCVTSCSGRTEQASDTENESKTT